MTKFLLKTTAKAVELAATLLLHNFQGFNIIINKGWVFCTYKLESQYEKVEDVLNSR